MTTESFQKQVSKSQADPSPSSENRVASQNADSGLNLTNAVVPRVLAFLVGLVLLVGLFLWGWQSLRTTDPYVQGVLHLEGDVDRGRDIFVLNCAVCHGLEATGEVGPDLQNVSERKSRVALIEQVISGQTPPMPQFQPSERDMADLLSFLETL